MARPPYNPDLFFRWHSIKTRFRDLDPLNHVNNAVFNSYFEEARIHLVESVPELSSSFKEGKSFVLAKCTIEYLRPVLYPATLLIGTGFIDLGNSSIDGFQALYDAETKKLHATAATKGVWFDLKTQRPTRLPEVEGIEKMKVYLDG
jgi:acyl-CoA thioester hydrolase